MRKFAILLIVAFAFCQAQAQEVYKDNIIIILDSSGSMNASYGSSQTRLEAAKSALHVVMKQADNNTNVGLLVLSGGINDWVYPLGPKDEQRLRDAINRPHPSGGTPLGSFIKKGADRLLQAREAQFGYGSYRLLIVTDGEANPDSEATKVEHYTKDIMSRGFIVVDVIGVAMEKEHTLATKVNSYKSADDPSSLTKAISEVFAEVSTKSSGDADKSAFDDIAGLNENAAKSMILGLTLGSNHLIGEAQPKIVVSEDGTVQYVPQQQASEGLSGGWIVLIILGIIFLIIIILIIIINC